MATIFEYPGGIPRYFTNDGGDTIFEYGREGPVFVVQDKTIYGMDGKKAFWLGEGDDVYLHPFDGTRARFYFDMFDRKPGDPVDEGKIDAAQFAVLVSKKGRRAAIAETLARAKKK
jgi:hypothetical protein